MELGKQKSNDKRALLIENNQFFQERMQNFLQELNYAVDLVARDKESVKMVLDNEYNLILLDINNKEFGKDEVISLIRESKNIGTPVIAWSEFIDEKNQDLNVIWGADSGLPKPCTIKNLKIVIDECSVFERHEREFVHKRINIIEKWEKYGKRINLIKEVFHLSDFQLNLLANALSIIAEYKLSEKNRLNKKSKSLSAMRSYKYKIITMSE